MKCRGCGAPMEWVKSTTGRNIPVDPKRVTVVLDDGQVVTGRVSHFATCPKAGEFRRAGADA